jgi:hypothetical protein
MTDAGTAAEHEHSSHEKQMINNNRLLGILFIIFPPPCPFFIMYTKKEGLELAGEETC